MRVCKDHAKSKSTDQQRSAFRLHVGRYLNLFAADAAFSLEKTDRYVRYRPGVDSDSESEQPPRAPVASTSKLDPDAPPAEPVFLDLCVIANRALKVGEIVPGLFGSLAELTEAENDALSNNVEGMAKDFSVIYSDTKKVRHASRSQELTAQVSHMFLGPARMVNHDCCNNIELHRSGLHVCFKVVRPIEAGDEILTYYGDAYFGRDNKDCLCATCERCVG